MLSVNNKEDTPLHKACERGHLEIVKLLVQHGANMEQKTQMFGRTALHISIVYGHSCLAEYLMSSGANICALDGAQYSILHQSLWFDNNKMANFLLDYFQKRKLGSELVELVHTPDVNKNTCLHSACLSGKSDLAYILIDEGSDLKAVNSDGETVLHMACRAFLQQDQTAERYKFVEHLIKKGSPINISDRFGSMPLHVAASKDDFLLVKCLVKNKADVNVKNLRGKTPLHLARKADVAGFLLKSGATINAQDLSGSTPLHVAASNDDFLLVKCLVNKKADVNAQNQNGETPLHLAHKADVTGFLLKNGATINAQDFSGSTPLHFAASNNALLVVQCLVNNKADINKPNKKGETPLQLAHKPDIIAFLLKNGANNHMQDINIYFYTNSQSLT